MTSSAALIRPARKRRVHHPRRHAAVRTDDYVFAQLIPYIGNKRKLLHLIGEALEMIGPAARGRGRRRGTCVDLFTGSTVVARFAKRGGWRVVANDLEPYAAEIARGTVALNRAPAFAALGGAEAVFDQLNGLRGRGRRGWVARHLCPADDEHADPARERMFFTQANGRRIDAIRDRIAEWEAAGAIDASERAYLLAALLYAVSYASNTSGVFKAYHHGWGGRTGTALYRICAPLRLAPPVLHDNRAENVALCDDAQRVAERLREHCGGASPDVVYIDPPYNQHPYGSNYHVLTSVALWDKPTLDPRVVIDGRPRDKAAIRKDWRTERRSAYNHAQYAHEAFARLVDTIDAPHLLVSYSTDGNIPLDALLGTLGRRGALRVVIERYKRYRVSTPRMSRKSHNVEFVAVVDTRRRAGANVERLAARIRAAEGGA